MKEPTTVKQAKQLTLDKIKRCMELPRKKRRNFWFKIRWPQFDIENGDHRQYCAFCIIYNIHNISDKCNPCIVKEICNWFMNNVKFYKKDLRKLYKMVEEVEG